MNPIIGLFNLLCVGIMVSAYLYHEPWSIWRVSAVILGAFNLAGAYVNLIQ